MVIVKVQNQTWSWGISIPSTLSKYLHKAETKWWTRSHFSRMPTARLLTVRAIVHTFEYVGEGSLSDEGGWRTRVGVGVSSEHLWTGPSSGQTDATNNVTFDTTLTASNYWLKELVKNASPTVSRSIWWRVGCACPSAMDAPLPCTPATYTRPCHKCLLPCIPLTMHTHLPCMPPAIHATWHTCPLTMHAPSCHAGTPVNKMTDRCKNISLPQLRWRR